MPDQIQPISYSRIRRDVVRAEGPDAAGYLQGQLSQDVAALAVGQSAWSFVLQPQGKVDAWLRVWREAGEAFVLDVDSGFGAALMARLERFKLRTRCDLSLQPGQPMVAVRGIQLDGGLACGWPDLSGSDHLGEQAPTALPAGALELDAAGYEVLRIRHGVPAMGAELTEATIPAEAGQWLIDASVSFTKGCYTGQELVARIDSRGGNVPRHLSGFTTDGPPPSTGAALIDGGSEVGVVTTSAPVDGGSVGLAYVRRGVELPATVEVGGIDALVSELPTPAG